MTGSPVEPTGREAMKLARVNHIRCDEQQAVTFVWVRHDMTEDEFSLRVKEASAAYLNRLDELRALDPPTVSTYSRQPNWNENRDRTVGQVLDEFEQAKVQAEKVRVAEHGATRSFAEYLADGTNVIRFWDPPEELLSSDAWWGHRHGTSIDYGENDDSVRDFVPFLGAKQEDWS